MQSSNVAKAKLAKVAKGNTTGKPTASGSVASPKQKQSNKTGSLGVDHTSKKKGKCIALSAVVEKPSSSSTTTDESEKKSKTQPLKGKRDELEEWREMFTEKREYDRKKIPLLHGMVPFWQMMDEHYYDRKNQSIRTEYDGPEGMDQSACTDAIDRRKGRSSRADVSDDIALTHGTMGWTYYYSVPYDQEFSVLCSFYESVYLQDQDICLAPTIVDKTYFVWFADVDIKQTVPLTIEYVKLLCETIAKTVSLFFPKLAEQPERPHDKSADYVIHIPAEQFQPSVPYSTYWDHERFFWTGAGTGASRLKFLFCTSGLKSGLNKLKQQEEGVGIHVHAIGHLIVNREQANCIFAALRVECERVLGPRNQELGTNEWTQVFDSGVYKGLGGTRTIGSCKVKLCDTCADKNTLNLLSGEKEDEAMNQFEDQWMLVKKGDGKRIDRTGLRKENPKTQDKSCPKCKDRKKYLDKRCYWMTIVLDRFGKRDDTMQWLLDDPFQGLMATYIRCRYTTLSAETSCFVDLPSLTGGGATSKRLLQTVFGQDLRAPLQNSTVLCGLEGPRKKWTAPKQAQIEAKNRQRYGEYAEETQLVLEEAKMMDQDKYYGLKAESLTRVRKDLYRLAIRESINHKYCMTCTKYTGVETTHLNRIYFDVDGRSHKIFQMSGSTNTECYKDSHAENRAMSRELIDVLFGQTADLSADMLWGSGGGASSAAGSSSGAVLFDGTKLECENLQELALRYPNGRDKDSEYRDQLLELTDWYLTQKSVSRDPGSHRARSLEQAKQKRRLNQQQQGGGQGSGKNAAGEDEDWRMKRALELGRTGYCGFFAPDEAEDGEYESDSVSIHDLLHSDSRAGHSSSAADSNNRNKKRRRRKKHDGGDVSDDDGGGAEDTFRESSQRDENGLSWGSVC